jgi:hypothetical protein
MLILTPPVGSGYLQLHFTVDVPKSKEESEKISVITKIVLNCKPG